MSAYSGSIFATTSGAVAFDSDGGIWGNPFATSLIEIVGRLPMTAEKIGSELKRLTSERTNYRQIPECPKSLSQFEINPCALNQRCIALILIYSDYDETCFNPLPGALHDAARISSALIKQGFSVQVEGNPVRSVYSSVIDEFAYRSKSVEVAFVYSTGHGMEVDGQVYLIPSDYTSKNGMSDLLSRSIRLDDLGACARASECNLTFFGGCRSNPFNL